MSVSGVRNSWLTLREEGGLGAVELGQRLGAPPLLLVAPGVGDGGGDLDGDELEEAAVLVVERAARADAGDQHAGGLRLPGARRAAGRRAVSQAGQAPPGDARRARLSAAAPRMRGEEAATAGSGSPPQADRTGAAARARRMPAQPARAARERSSIE